MAELFAKLINWLLPADQRLPHLLRWMYQYRFVRMKRGRRVCAQCNKHREPNYELYPCKFLEVGIVIEGRTLRKRVIKRPPHLCADCNNWLYRQGLTEISVYGDSVGFMRDGHLAQEVEVGEGLVKWAKEL